MNNSKTLSIIIKARDEASATMQKVAGNTDKASAQIKQAAKTAALAGLAMAAAIGVSAVKSAGNYESSLSKLRQASNATGDEMTRMANLARELGKDTDLAGVTASDAAAAMTELAKAGLSVKDTMGASKGVMSLAKAGQMEFADAAVLAASALNAFGLQGRDAVKVADALAAGANASQADLSDLGMGLQQSATVAKQFGLNINEVVTSLSLFANSGIRGSDAGTSLKTMLIALARPSKQAADAMQEIGFKAYDAEGNFVGLREMSSRLATSLEGLTEEQKQATLATIFGTDAFRAASVLAENTGVSYDRMSQSVSKVGAAQQAAAAQLGPFQKMMEGLSNTASEIGLRIGMSLLPALTSIGNVIQANAIPAFNGLVAVLTGQVPIFTMAGVAMLSYGAITTSVSMYTKALTIAQAALNAVLRANPYVIVASLAAGLVSAYIGVINQTNNNTNATNRLNAAQRALTAATDAAKAATDRLRDAQLNETGAALAVERAKRNERQAIQQYGASSLEAKEASYQLSVAERNLADATRQVASSANSAKNAQNNLAAAKNAVVAANSAMGGSASNAAGGYRTLAEAANAARSAVQSANSQSMNVNKALSKGLELPGRASGGPVRAGQPYIVGENEPELFVPRTSGTILNQKQMADAGIGGGSTSFKMYGNIVLSSPQAVNSFFDRLNAQKELGNYGAGV